MASPVVLNAIYVIPGVAGVPAQIIAHSLLSMETKCARHGARRAGRLRLRARRRSQPT